MYIDEGKSERKKICCPVCGKTAFFVEKPGNSVIEIKCARCRSTTSFDLGSCSPLKRRLTAKRLFV